MISYTFNPNKIIQIVNYLLNKNSGRLNYTKLIKLLYIADKRFFKKWDLSITNDNYSSMKQGPVLSKTYDLIKGDYDQPEQLQWNCLFFKDSYNIVQIKENNLNTNLLSKAEILILNEVDSEFKEYSWQELVEYTHDKELFPEVKWEEAEKSDTSIPLDIEDILQSLNRSTNEINLLSQEIRTQQKVADLILS